MPVQNVAPAASDELDPELQVLHYSGKITRGEGYVTLRALSHALKSIGLPLEVFERDDRMVLGPLTSLQTRRWCSERCQHVVHDAVTDTTVAEIPVGFKASLFPLLVSVSDQGPLNVPGLDMLSYCTRCNIVVIYDIFHRAWNDLKDGLRRANLYKTFLLMFLGLGFRVRGNSKPLFAVLRTQVDRLALHQHGLSTRCGPCPKLFLMLATHHRGNRRYMPKIRM